MIKNKIHHLKTSIPLSVSVGSVEQRFQKARLFNLKFYDELQDCIKKDEIKPRVFSNKLKSVLGAKLGITILPVDAAKDSYTKYSLNQNFETIGYTLGLPLDIFSNGIHKNYAPYFLKETQNLLNEAFNPKIIKRFMCLLSKGADINKIIGFYQKNLASEALLEDAALEEFLHEKTSTQSIDELQFLRYRLLSEKNTKLASYQIDRRIGRHNDLHYVRPEGYYSLEKYHYDEKLNKLENKLQELIQENRSKS